VIGAIPALQAPVGGDIVGVLPVAIVAFFFILLMLADTVVPHSKAMRLAVLANLGAIAGLVCVAIQWFKVPNGYTVYYGSFAYDRFGLFVDALVLIAALVTIWISPQYLNRRGNHYGEYYALILAATAGMMLLAGAMSLMVIFLGVELLSIALYILSGFARGDEHSQEAGLKYLLLGGFASGFLLYGMALVYGETGHTQLSLIYAELAAQGSRTDPLLAVGVVLIFAGLAFKISAAPFHSWTPDVYQGAPTTVTAFMSVATKVAAFAAIVRVLTYAVPELLNEWRGFVAIVAIASMLVGNLGALGQTSIKRLLAYSGIAQAGYILIGVASLGSASASPARTITAVLIYLAAYTFTNLGAFAVIAVTAGRGEDLDSYDTLRGLASRRPYAAAAMSLFLLSLAGFPPTMGFFGKFFLFSAAIASSHTELALWGIATSAISVFYYLRVILLMYGKPANAARPYAWSRVTLGGASALIATAAATLFLGIAAAGIYGVASDAQTGHAQVLAKPVGGP